MTAQQTIPLVATVPKARPWAPLAFAVSTVLLVGWGFSRREDLVLSAETGFGYALGIIGVSCMVLLLMYPLAKRVRFFQRAVAVRHWFRIHMMLGIAGPTAILFHCNFQWGSLNSSVALVCMLLVVASGLIGRYFYSKVHLGLYGQKASSQSLLNLARHQQQQLRIQFAEYPDMAEQVDQFFNQFLSQNPGQFSITRAMLASPRRWWLRMQFRRAIRRHRQPQLQKIWRDAQKTLAAYLDTLRKLAQLQFFERLLSWWHILHMPFFVMMLFTAVIHVWAVHVY